MCSALAPNAFSLSVPANRHRSTTAENCGAKPCLPANARKLANRSGIRMKARLVVLRVFLGLFGFEQPQRRMLVRAVGLEPTRANALRILSPICLPFHHARNAWCGDNRRPAGGVKWFRQVPGSLAALAQLFSPAAGSCCGAPLAIRPTLRATHRAWTRAHSGA